jgi:hypothetical protein
MKPEIERQPNPMHQPETSFDGEVIFITENPPGGAPLDSVKVVERERRRQEQLAQGMKLR